MTRGELLSIVPGNPCDVIQLEAALRGQDAVLSALGSSGFGPTSLCSDAAHSTVEAMSRTGVRRLVIISSALLFPNLGLLATILRRFVFYNVLRDALEMERVVSETELNWTVARPPRLTDGQHTGRYRVEVNQLPQRGRTIPRANLAHFMLDELETERHFRMLVGVCN